MGSDTSKPLWTCPECGARLVTRNLWHSCGRATLDDWTARIAFMGRVRFGSITSLSERGMTCSFALPAPLDSPRLVNVKEVAPGWWVHRLRVTDPSQLDEEVQAWVRESYRLMGMQERLLG
ncbi:MAG: DUF5655 domain-containing protein [Gemmatimonadota bacterium]